MKKTLGLLIILLAAPALAEPLEMNDPNFEVLVEVRKSIDGAWYRENDKAPWLVADDAGDLAGARCTKALAAAAKAGVPSSRKLPLQNDNPDLQHGEHTLAELKPVCANIERFAKIHVWEKWSIGFARGNGRGSNDVRQLERCRESYEELLKSGVAKTAKVLEREILAEDETKIAWAGTVEALHKKYCVDTVKKAKADLAGRDALRKKGASGR